MAISQRNLEVLQTLAVVPPTVVSGPGVLASASDLAGGDGDLVVALQGTAAGAGNSFFLRLEHSDTVTGGFAPITGAEFPPIGNAAYNQRVVVSLDDIKRYVRVTVYDMNGSGSTTVSATGITTRKYK